MLTVLGFILVISVLVLVHEFGHFWVAKKSGMRVEEFGIGFPPRLLTWRRAGTLYSINLIPFGGFVRILGEDGSHRSEPGSFGHGTYLQRFGVIVAGVVMNFLLAAVLLIVGNFLGLRVGIFDEATAARATDVRIQIVQVAAGSPGEAGGLQSLDEIIGFRDAGSFVAVQSAEAVQEYAFSHAGKPVTMVVRRGSTDTDIRMQLRTPRAAGEGPIGISLAPTGIIRYPWYENFWRGFAMAGTLFIATLTGFWFVLTSLVTGNGTGAEISGPIGIATLTGQAARVGFNYLLQFVALISVNLAVLNILPFPALDGGRAAILLIERLRRKPLARRVEEGINAAGFAVLITLMVVVTVKDIVKFF
jgi:regulator of sigma E protease